MCQGEAWAWLRALALLLWLASCSDVVVRASESPDRECCEPLYPFIPGLNPPPTGTGYTTPALPPELIGPEIPDDLLTQRPAFFDVTIEQQEIATTTLREDRPAKPG